MACTLKGQFFFASGFDKQRQINTFNYLKARSIYPNNQVKNYKMLDDKIIYIELKNMPYIVKKLRDTLYFDDIEELKENVFSVNIMEMSELGILVYIVEKVGDNLLFIPASEIICLHTITDEFIKDVHQSIKQGLINRSKRQEKQATNINS